MKSIVLDTNGYTALMIGNKEVLSCLNKTDTIYLSVFVLGELYAGFRGGSKMKQNLEILDRFLLKSSVKTLLATRDTSEIFGDVKNRLKKAGTPIPLNDVWIASHVFETGSVLVTLDNHFNVVPGLRICEIL